MNNEQTVGKGKVASLPGAQIEKVNLAYAAIPDERSTALRKDNAVLRRLQSISGTGTTDMRNCVLLLLGLITLILLISPARVYPMTDNWLYYFAVEDILQLRYTGAEWSQTTGVTLYMWGALFALVFGNTFTVLAVANIIVSAACLLQFYALLRTLHLRPGQALLGSAVLGLNPMYVYLSFAFMTDVMFLACMLATLVCFVRWTQEDSVGWLVLGGVAAALSYLTRQFGLVLPITLLGYMWFSGRWRWKHAFASLAAPMLAFAAYTLWERAQPVPLVAYHMQPPLEALAEWGLQYATGRVQHLAWTVTLLGIYLVPVLRLPRRPLLAVPFFLVQVFLLVRGFFMYGTLFPENGNVVDRNGFVQAGYNAQPVWPETVWIIIGLVNAFLISLIIASMLEALVAWLKARRLETEALKQGKIIHRARLEPGALVYLAAAMMAVTIVILTPNLFDRYWLPILPAMIVFGLSGQAFHSSTPENGKRVPGVHGWQWAATGALGVLAVVGMSEYRTHLDTKWQVAQAQAASGTPKHMIKAGFEWDALYMYHDGVRVLKQGPLVRYILPPWEVVADPEYMVSDVPVDGYSEVSSTPYHSWLAGQQREVLLLKRK